MIHLQNIYPVQSHEITGARATFSHAINETLHLHTIFKMRGFISGLHLFRLVYAETGEIEKGTGREEKEREGRGREEEKSKI